MPTTTNSSCKSTSWFSSQPPTSSLNKKTLCHSSRRQRTWTLPPRIAHRRPRSIREVTSTIRSPHTFTRVLPLTLQNSTCVCLRVRTLPSRVLVLASDRVNNQMWSSISSLITLASSWWAGPMPPGTWVSSTRRHRGLLRDRYKHSRISLSRITFTRLETVRQGTRSRHQINRWPYQMVETLWDPVSTFVHEGSRHKANERTSKSFRIGTQKITQLPQSAGPPSPVVSSAMKTIRSPMLPLETTMSRI